MKLKIISAGAGSGKTYTLTQEMAGLLSPKNGQKSKVRASGIIATTFTNKAAAELKERVRIKLLDDGLSQEADELGNALIGTVHSIGVQLLKRFAFEAGVSPNVDIIADADHQAIFNQSLSTVLSISLIERMNYLSECLGLEKDPYRRIDWRSEMRNLVNVARANNFDILTIEKSKQYSIKSYLEVLPPVSDKNIDFFDDKIAHLIKETLQALQNNEDHTKGKQTLMGKLKGFQNALRNRGELYWHEWASLSKLSAPKKSRDDIFDLVEFAKSHDRHPAFHTHITEFISHLFDTSIAAIQEYQSYKKARGLIDYTDMEVLILELLENEMVLEVLSDEIDLLLVDEFQDTNGLQMRLLQKLVGKPYNVCVVGDDDQSIYGWRGADVSNILQFEKFVPNPKVILLEINYRSSAAVLHTANSLIKNNIGRREKELKPLL